MLIQLSLKFEPSPEEKVVIHRLETALSRALGDDEYYDVIDELDDPPPSDATTLPTEDPSQPNCM